MSDLLNILSRIDDALLRGVRERSEYLWNELSGADGIVGVSGLGLMIGIETKKDAGEVIAACRERGVLVIKAKSKVRLLPALNIPMDDWKAAIAIIKEVCKQ